MSAPQIVGFDPEPGFKGYDEEDGLASGMFHYDDGTSRFGQLPAEQVADLMRNKQLPAEPMPNGPPPAMPSTSQAPPTSQAPLMSEPQTSEAPPNMSVGKPAPAAASPKPSAPPPTPYDAFEEQQANREKSGNPMSIDIPKSSRIAYVHNNPGNLKYVGQEGAQRGEPADDGGHWAAFESPEAGYAALHGQIQHDAKEGMTLGAFITKYAPPSSNDTASYIASASHALGADPNTPISSMNEERLARFMAHAESSTTVGGITPSSSAPAGSAGAVPGYPKMLGGLPVSQIQEHGVPLSPEEIAQHQTDIYNRTMGDVAVQQQVAQARIQGRQEMQDAQVAQYRQDQQDALGEMRRQEAVKTQAEHNVQREILQPIQKVDPNRYIKDMSVGGRILGIVGMMSAAIGNALVHSNGPNGGVQLLLQNIDHDIDAQKDEIANGRAQSQNRIAFWTQRLGSAESGLNAAKLEAKQAVANLLQAKSVGVQNADIRAQMLQASQQLISSGQQEASQLMDKERDRLSITAAVPKPVKGGGAEDADKAMKLALHMEELGYKPDQIKAALGGMGLAAPGGPSVKAQKSTADQTKADLAAKKAEEARGAMNEDQGKAENVMSSMDDLYRKSGLIRDPDTHHWKPGPGLISPATKEQVRNVWGLNPFADKPIRSALSATAQSLGHFLAGARIDPDKLEIYEKLLGSEAATRQQVADAANAIELTVLHRRSAKQREQPQDASSDGFEATP